MYVYPPPEPLVYRTCRICGKCEQREVVWQEIPGPAASMADCKPSADHGAQLPMHEPTAPDRHEDSSAGNK